MKRKRERKANKKLIIVSSVVITIILIIGIVILLLYLDRREKERAAAARLENIQKNYNSVMLTKTDTNLYNEKYESVGSVSANMYLELEDLGDYYKDGYYKLKDDDLYIKYDSLKKAEPKSEDEVRKIARYKNYIPFNKNVVTTKDTKLYTDEKTYYMLKESMEMPVIIDDNDKYYVSFDDKLVYVLKDEVTTKDTEVTSEVADAVAVLNYHYTINLDAGEGPLCDPSSICLTDTLFDAHIKYIKDNGFYSITMQELEMFLDDKINLPKKSVAITIDDGWFVARSIQVLERYDVMATLFLIGWLAPPTDYASKNLEVHSHTWNLHNVSNCSGGRSPLLCYDKNTIVEDLKKSRESLNNTTYFCYPFYDYNDHAIEAVKEAGFTMALTDGNVKARRGVDKYKVPRYIMFDNTSVQALANMIN